MDLYDFKSHADLGSWGGEGSSSWGWVSKDKREFVAIGQYDGTAFAEITKEGKLSYLGRLPQQSVPSVWREIRILDDLCIIGSEARDHGVQVFNMTKLLKISPSEPANFSTSTDLTGLFNDLPIGRTHNIVVNWDLDYAVAVGAQPRNSTCRSGLIFIDLSDPSNPTSPGCAGQDGYVHDAQCVKYNGPDTRFVGRDICVGFNEDTITIYDATIKTGINSTSVLSRLTYKGASYTHQGSFIDAKWHQYMVVDDELDEQDMVGPAADQIPVTYIFDLTSLTNPKQTGHFKATDHKGIDHNQYVHDGLSYQSNYGAGLWVHDVSSIPDDPTGGSVEVSAFFDIYPEDDAVGGISQFVGTWSHYGPFPSGYVVINTIERGAFVVKHSKFAGKAHGKGHGKGKGRP
jgi:choice-of-anchor B domain-containing protein